MAVTDQGTTYHPLRNGKGKRPGLLLPADKARLDTLMTGGLTGARPATPALYQSYFDTTLHKLIVWDGAVWRDGAGASV